jgi:hypothetical protein
MDGVQPDEDLDAIPPEEQLVDEAACLFVLRE